MLASSYPAPKLFSLPTLFISSSGSLDYEDYAGNYAYCIYHSLCLVHHISYF